MKQPQTKTIITFGSFDVLHVGHLRILRRARDFGTSLIVGLSTDQLNLEKKARLPVYPYEQRKELLLALSCVDAVFAEESLDRKAEYLRNHDADMLVMGDDWRGKFDSLAEVCEVRYLPRTPSISTTSIIEQIRT